MIHGLPEINSVACVYESTLTYRCGGSAGIASPVRDDAHLLPVSSPGKIVPGNTLRLAKIIEGRPARRSRMRRPDREKLHAPRPLGALRHDQETLAKAALIS